MHPHPPRSVLIELRVLTAATSTGRPTGRPTGEGDYESLNSSSLETGR